VQSRVLLTVGRAWIAMAVGAPVRGRVDIGGMNTGAAKRVHFIAIGGSAMHNLAIALHQQGVEVTGSDDEIFEPSRSRLLRLGLLPDRLGWDPGNITPDIDAVILGMHARVDNPELQRARELGIPVFSYPAF